MKKEIDVCIVRRIHKLYEVRPTRVAFVRLTYGASYLLFTFLIYFF